MEHKTVHNIFQASWRKMVSALFLLLWISTICFAQDFVYKPRNPAFGGDIFNYQWMLSSAQAQNSFTDKDTEEYDYRDRDPLDDFTSSLNRQVLNQLSRELINLQFGEEGLDEGSYIIGDFGIDVVPTLDGISITILDISTGNQTVIEIPFY